MSATNTSNDSDLVLPDPDNPDIKSLHTPTARIVTISYLALMAVLGTVGNMLVILSVVKTSKLQRLTYLLIANLSVVGLLVCLVIIPFHIFNIVNVGKVNSNTTLCEFEGYMNFMLTLAMLVNSDAIALNRYLVVNRQQVSSPQPERTRNVVIIIALLWTIPVMISFSSLPYVGYHEFILDCFFLASDNAYWYVVIAISAPAILTTAFISVSYSLILRKVRQSRLKVMATMAKTGEEHTSSCSDIPSELINFPQPSTSTGVCCTTSTTIADVTQSIAETMSKKKKQYKRTDSRKGEQQRVNQLQISTTEASRTVGANLTGQAQVVITVVSKPAKSRLAAAKFKQEVRLTLHLFLVFTLFCVLYLPMCMVHILHVVIPVSPDVWLTFFTLALSFSTITWMLYGVLNRDFRQAYVKLIFCKK
ncbi:alpha-2 adrenergic receptor-like [Haliotis cracherodii]|uniref:alpha-2 adrenergic receptor-like n=1 Tax=Haliotis cracherodii TaxID=6455 RepID=UPI0039E79001